MRKHLSKIVIIAALLIVVGVPLLMRPAGAGPGASGGSEHRLIIYSPHNEQIRYEFAHGFNAWRVARGKPAVEFDWRSSGGTSDLRKQILSQFEALKNEAVVDDRGIGADLFFGGGEHDHNRLVQGVKLRMPDETEAHVPVSKAPTLPDGLIAEAFPSAKIGGEKLYHDDLMWIGTALSSFGIVYNRHVFKSERVDEPTTWADLTDPRLYGRVAMADPAHSGSIKATYNTILKREGWTEGWWILRRSFANARYFTSSASKVPVDVSAGEAGAGMCIDFYGRFQAGAVAVPGERSRVGYIDPVGLTATTADPVSLLRGSKHEDLANEFIAWLLSVEAQRLWQRRIGTEQGPVRFELRRQPIRIDMYTADERAEWTDPEIDPFGQASAMPEGTPDYFSYVAPLSHAIAMDIHAELKAAWRAIQATPDSHPNKAEMLRLFDAMPDTLTLRWEDPGLERDWKAIMLDTEHPRRDEVVQTLSDFKASLKEQLGNDEARQRARLAWTRFFKRNYEQIVRLSKQT